MQQKISSQFPLRQYLPTFAAISLQFRARIAFKDFLEKNFCLIDNNNYSSDEQNPIRKHSTFECSCNQIDGNSLIYAIEIRSQAHKQFHEINKYLLPKTHWASRI